MENKNKICVVLGTRPEIVKMAPIIRRCLEREIDFFVIHTGQHYSYEMDKIFFKDLELPDPKYNLSVGSGLHGEQTGKMLKEIEKILIEEKPSIVLVQGDTNSVLAGALAASKLHIKIGHIEAGLRSYDRSMPEEINRIITDHISNMLFVPTETAKDNLNKEGISGDKIIVTGNTIVDSVLHNIKLANKKSNILKELSLEKNKFFLLTVHRAENTDDELRLRNIIESINKISEEYSLPIIWPIHPRTKSKLEQCGLNKNVFECANLKIIEPLGFLDFIQLENNTILAITDSGGVQEETCILGVPCVTLRDNTERPETVHIGANLVAGTKPEAIIDGVRQMINKKEKWQNPFGSGDASDIIIDSIILSEKEFINYQFENLGIVTNN